ncbi:unnamed protein product, partial [Candidula unifasciata]
MKDLCSDRRSSEGGEHSKPGVSSDVEKLKSLSSSSPSPLNEPLTIIITDEYKDEKFSPSSRDLSDDCSSVQSQDSRRSSLRRSTMTQRNAAPAHLAKTRSKESKLSMSPDGSSCSSLLSPKSCTSRIEDKPSPKETMLEAVGLISRRSLELSPNSDIDGTALNKPLRLQPRVSPTAMTPKREKRSPAHAGAGGNMRPSIMAGGLPKPGSSTVKSIAITYDPVIIDDVKLDHHPLIHHKKGVDSLPQPTLEEEVVATPLDLGRGEHPHGPGARSDRERSQSRLKFEITSDDGFSCQGDTVEDAWNQVLERVQDVRAASRMKQLSYAGISGRTMFGLDHNAVVYLIEQLYGALHCHHNYKFRFHKYDLDQADEEVALNPSGAARSESFASRKPFDMFNFLKSVYRTKPGDDEREKEEEMALKSSRRATSLSLPMAMRFRKLKTFAKEAVDVYRSKIHGRGLFCKRNIDAGEMVIEYAGEVIRASLTDKREKYYESK